MIRRDRLFSSPHKIPKYFFSVCSSHVQNIDGWYFLHTWQQWHSAIFTVISLVTFMINWQSMNNSTLQSFPLHVFKLSSVKLKCNNHISIAFHKQDNPPLRSPHNARSTTPHFPTHYIWNLCRRSSSNQGRPAISLQVYSDLSHRPQCQGKLQRLSSSHWQWSLHCFVQKFTRAIHKCYIYLSITPLLPSPYLHSTVRKQLPALAAECLAWERHSDACMNKALNLCICKTDLPTAVRDL